MVKQNELRNFVRAFARDGCTANRFRCVVQSNFKHKLYRLKLDMLIRPTGGDDCLQRTVGRSNLDHVISALLKPNLPALSEVSK